MTTVAQGKQPSFLRAQLLASDFFKYYHKNQHNLLVFDKVYIFLPNQPPGGSV
jgi:hypothetical protein